MKFKLFTVDIIFFCFLLMNQIKAEEEWCWTVPDLKVKIEADKFGYNYGLCQ